MKDSFSGLDEGEEAAEETEGVLLGQRWWEITEGSQKSGEEGTQEEESGQPCWPL